MEPRLALNAVRVPRPASTEDVAVIESLLTHGAELEAQDKQGNKCLHYATAWGNLKAVRMLLAAGAPPFVRNRANHTPFEYSVTKQAAQYFQSIIAEMGKLQQGQDGAGFGTGLQLNTAVPPATGPDEPRSAASVQSKTKNPLYPKGMSSPSKGGNVGGLRLVIDTENNELADIEDDDDAPYTAKRISAEEQRV